MPDDTIAIDQHGKREAVEVVQFTDVVPGIAQNRKLETARKVSCVMVVFVDIDTENGQARFVIALMKFLQAG